VLPASSNFLYFVGRRDEMIKTSGYRVSPAEVEDILYGTGLVSECIAFGIPHETLGQAIYIIATCQVSIRATAKNNLMSQCRIRMPTYMVPAAIEWVEEPLPRNANGKIDRALLARAWLERQRHAPSPHPPATE
jgi:acyl-coenzyme A synthetase/AMP-(fatty) acid ligase